MTASTTTASACCRWWLRTGEVAGCEFADAVDRLPRARRAGPWRHAPP
jgi:hypothetical protein